jgi:hypothetical protein
MTVAATSSVVPARPVRVSATSRSRRASVSPSRKNGRPAHYAAHHSAQPEVVPVWR